MKVVQTFWSGRKKILEDGYGWQSPKHHIMSWVLSCLCLRENYNEVVLYADSPSYIVFHEVLNMRSDQADKICSMLSKGGCKGVLESSSAKLFGLIEWSEVGMSYFISNVIVLVFFPYLLPYLALVNICTLPYSFLSVWYQKFKAKQSVVTNPYCGYCAEMHKRIEKLIGKIGDKIMIRYIYAADQKTETGCKSLMAVYFNEKLTTEQKKGVFMEWYKDAKNRNESFLNKYKGDSVNEIAEKEMEKHKKWCTQTNNSATPVVFINGHKLPENYVIEDILWFIQ